MSIQEPSKELRPFIPKPFLSRWNRLPEYLRKLFINRALNRYENQVAGPRRRKEAREEKRRQIKALRKPPAKIYRQGRVLTWEPPSTAHAVKPEGYWIWEKRHGSWTQHGTLIRPNKRRAVLYGNNPAKVVTKYPQQALGEYYPSQEIPPYDE